MKKFLLLLSVIFIFASLNVVSAINPVIKVTGIAPPTGCAGGTIIVTYSDSGGTFNSGCTFKVQLSNGFGQFTTPVDIGSSAINLGAMLCNIPAGTPLGVLYRVRVVASNPADTSAPSAITSPLIITTPPTPTITANPTTDICEGDSVILSSSISLRYLWSNGDTTQTTKIFTSGTYTCAVTLAGSCSATSLPKTVTVKPAPLPTIIALGGYLISSTAPNYQWNESGNPIAGETSQSYSPTVPGSYTVTVTYANGCSRTSDPVISTGIAELNTIEDMVLYPNPVSGNATLHCTMKSGAQATIQVRNILGNTISSFNQRMTQGANSFNMDCSELSSGIYFVSIQTETENKAGRIFVK